MSNIHFIFLFILGTKKRRENEKQGKNEVQNDDEL